MCILRELVMEILEHLSWLIKLTGLHLLVSISDLESRLYVMIFYIGRYNILKKWTSENSLF